MPKTAPDSIPMHRLQGSQRNGLKLHRVTAGDLKAHKVPDYSHRDDYYIIALQEQGQTTFMLDFTPVVMKGPCLIYILPGQVHSFTDVGNASGWFLGFDPLLVDEPLRDLFEEALGCSDPLPLDPAALHRLCTCLELLLEQQDRYGDALFTRQVIHALLASFLGMMATLYQERAEDRLQLSNRPLHITRAFRKMLRQQFHSLKSPAAYAAAQHLSPSYLNESVKAVTGLSVSQHIHQEILLEARRLLYYSDKSVKEIAYELGYEDHTYFSRLFRKVIGITPGEFRAQYRE